MEDKIKSDLNYLVGNTPVLFDNIFEKVKPHYPALTEEEFLEMLGGNNQADRF